MTIKIIPRRIVCLYNGWVKDTVRFLRDKNINTHKTIASFESAFCSYTKMKYSFAVNSGRFSFDLILRVLKIKEGDEVIIPSYTDESIPETLKKNKIKPVFVDICPDSHNIDTDLIEEKITKCTKAIIATHIFGQPCNMKEIKRIGAKNSLKIIEDCAHAFGTKKIGQYSDAVFFSLADSKPLTTFAGGMVCTQKKEVAKELKKELSTIPPPDMYKIFTNSIFYAVIQHYLVKRPFFPLFVYPGLLLLQYLDCDITKLYGRTVKKAALKNPVVYRFSPYQAWVGIHALEAFDAQNRRRVENADILYNQLDPEVKKMCKLFNPDTNLYFFVLVTQKRDGLAGYLLKFGIDTGKYIMRHCPRLFGDTERYPQTDFIYENSIQIPIHHTLTKKEMIFTGQKINVFFK